MTKLPPRSRDGAGARESAADDADDSPLRLLGERIRATAGLPDASATGLRVLVIYAAEYARLHGAAAADFLSALERTVAVHAAQLDEAGRERLRFAVLHWGRLAFADADDPLTHGKNKYES
jgi:hypothetical protein